MDVGHEPYEKDVLKNLYSLFLHDVNNTQAILRQSVAKGHGVDPEKFGVPLPGSTTSNTTVSNGMGWPAMLALAASLLGAGGLGAYIARTAIPPVVVQPNTTTITPFDPTKYGFNVIPDDSK